MEESHIIIVAVAFGLAIVLPVIYLILACRDARDENKEK